MPTEKPTPTLGDFKSKSQTLLTDIMGKQYLKCFCNPKTATEKSRLSKKDQDK